MGWDWNAIEYDIHDFFTESYAERQRNKYQSVVSQLNNSIDTIRSTLDSARSRMSCIFEHFFNEGKDSRGYFADEFIRKAMQHQDGVNRLLGKMESSIGELNSKRRRAQSKYEYWCRVCEREDREKREYHP